ncbi:hypothetical protein ABT272_43990, partial [Streptomyces sp900105245]
MTPPARRTWARRGRTPVIRVRGRSQRRYSIAALTCYRPGERSRLIYRSKRHADHKSGGRRSLDTHKDVHVAAVITVLGALLARQEFPATAAGY